MSRTSTPDLIVDQKDTVKDNPNSSVNCLRRSSQNVIHIPQSYSESFLWDSSNNPPVSGKEPPVEPIFSDELVAEVLALATYAFSCSEGTVQSGIEGFKESHERSMTLYCPDKCGNVVLDSMVKLIAARNNADVLVLDALELAAGEFGALGENGRVIDSIYKEAAKVKKSEPNDKSPRTSSIPKPDENEKPRASGEDTTGKGTDTQHIQAFFNTLLSMPSKCSPRCDREECESTVIKPLRRIIYLRDFGTIAPSAKPLMPYILHAIHNSRNRCCSEGMTWVPLLVMGTTKPMGHTEDGDDTSNDDDDFLRWLQRRFMGGKKDAQPSEQYKTMCAGGYKLTGLIPGLDSKYPTSKSEPSSVLFNGLSAQLFLPLVTQPSQLNYRALEFDSTWSAQLDDLAAHSVFLCIVTKNPRTETARSNKELDIRERTQDINDTLIRISVGRRGGLIEQGLSQKILTEWSENDDFRSSILSPSTAETIATIAVGLSQSGSKPMSITPAHVSQGYRIFLDAQRYRTSWTDEEKKWKSNVDQEGVQADPIVKEVKKASKLSGAERGLLQCIVDTVSLKTTFDDVCVDPQVVEMLRTVVSLPILHPEYFKNGILAKEALTGVLLYGPPGTGKTMLCRALAHECGARMIAVKSSDILDKYVGESDKNASAVFTLAYRLAPCVVFIDEVDALFGARNSGSESDRIRRSILTEFMQAMDGLQSAEKNKKKGIVVIGATNRPYDIDEAIFRRLPCRVLVDLPDEIQRKKILEVHLKDEICDADLSEIADGADGYSGSDLKNLCVSAALASVKDAIGGFDWKKSSKDTSVDPDGAANDAPPKTTRIITMAHFTHALSEVAPSFSEEASEELYRWNDMYSTNGNFAPRGSNSNLEGKNNGYSQLDAKDSEAHLKLPSFLDMMAQFQK